MKQGELLAIALGYHARGWNVLPIPAFSKKSCIAGDRWFNRRQTSDDVRKLFENHEGNIAIVCGGVSGNLCVFDAETPELFQAGLDFVTKVSSRSFVHAVQTARGGHIYFVTKRPIRTIGKRNGCDYEIRSTGSYVMAPPSIHPSGTQYEQLHTASYLPMLDEWPGLARSNGVDFEELPRPSRKAWDIMSGKASYPSRSEADHALILSLHLSGFTLREIEAKIMSSRCPSKLRSVSERRRLLEIERSISKSNSPADAIALQKQLILQVLDEANCHAWSGRTGNGDRLVLHAHIAIAKRAGRMEYCASERELSNFSTVSRDTVRLANERLIAAGWISRAPTSSKGTFILKICETRPLTPLRQSTLTPLCLSGRVSQLGVTALKGAAEVGGVGRTAAHLWEHLGDGPRKAVDLARVTGKCLPTVFRALKKLSGVGAARRGLVAGEWEAVAETDWNLVAIQLDVRHKSARRKHIHLQQQQSRRDAWLDG